MAFDYVDNNRRNYNEFQSFHIPINQEKIILSKIKKWVVDELGNDENISQLKLEIVNNQNYIMNRLSALIIRQIWGWPKMQIFLNQTDTVISTSLSLLKK